MLKIFHLRSLELTALEPYAELISDLANESLKPGAKKEILSSKDTGMLLYSVRRNNADRLLYTIIEDGDNKGDVVLCGVADMHDYKSVMRKLQAGKGVAYDIVPYSLMGEEPAEREVDDVVHPNVMHFGRQSIEFDAGQEEVLRGKFPLVIHGAPGTGKTWIGLELVKNYIQKPVMGEDSDSEEPLNALFLFPTVMLAEKTKTEFVELCKASGIDEAQMALVNFTTYDIFFKESTPEGRAIETGVATGFADFEAWYKTLPDYNRLEVFKTKFTAADYWASFRMCSLYSDVAPYIKLGRFQCDLPEEARLVVYDLYQRYKEKCHIEKRYSPWVTPFSGDKKFGLVVLDESHNQSGCTVLSAYKLAQWGRFVALVGDHQKINDPESSYGGYYSAADLLALFLYQTESLSVNSHFLRNTYRNSEDVVNVVNYFVNIKRKLGFHTAVKGADCFLNGHNGERGSAAMYAKATNKQELFDLHQRFEGNPDVVVIAPAIAIDEIRMRWPKNLVMTPTDALGLEFSVVICEGLLAEEQGNYKIDPILTDVAQEGHRAKQLEKDSAASQQESCLTRLIMACSRAKKGVYFIEENEPNHNEMGLIFGLKERCKESLIKEYTDIPVSYEQWLTIALKLLKENTPQMDEEAKRTMDANRPSVKTEVSEAIYAEFLTQYNANQQTRTPCAQEAASIQSAIASSAVATESSKQQTALQIKHGKKKVTDKKTTINTSKSQSKAELLWSDFNEENLSNALKGCKDMATFFQQTVESGTSGEKATLIEIFDDDEKRSIFVRFFINNFGKLSLNYTSSLAVSAKKHCKTNLASFFKDLKKIKDMLCRHASIDTQALLDVALENGMPKTLEILPFFHANGINLNYPIEVRVSNTSKRTIMTTAARRAVALGKLGYLKVLKTLGYELNQPDAQGNFPVHYAVLCGQLEVLKFLHSEGYDLTQLNLKKEKYSPCYLAVQEGNVEILKFLKDVSVFDINQPDPSGFTPAYYAAMFGHVNILIFLRMHGFELNQAVQGGITLAHVAAKHGRIEVLSYLNKISVDISQADDEGNTPAQLAADGARAFSKNR